MEFHIQWRWPAFGGGLSNWCNYTEDGDYIVKFSSLAEIRFFVRDIAGKYGNPALDNNFWRIIDWSGTEHPAVVPISEWTEEEMKLFQERLAQAQKEKE